MKHPRLYASSVLLKDGKVLICGGGSGGSVFPSEIEMFDPAAPAGSQGSVVGNLRQPRWQHFSHLLQNGKVLLVGGQRDGVGVESAELFDPSLPFSVADAVPQAPFGFNDAAFVPLPNGSLLPDGSALLLSGVSGSVARDASGGSSANRASVP